MSDMINVNVIAMQPLPSVRIDWDRLVTSMMMSSTRGNNFMYYYLPQHKLLIQFACNLFQVPACM